MTLPHSNITPPPEIDVAIIEMTGLGDRSYLISIGDIAVVIDPQRDDFEKAENLGLIR